MVRILPKASVRWKSHEAYVLLWYSLGTGPDPALEDPSCKREVRSHRDHRFFGASNPGHQLRRKYLFSVDFCCQGQLKREL